MHSKSGNIKIMINDVGDEVIKEIFDSLKNKHQNNLEPMKGSEFVFAYAVVLQMSKNKSKAFLVIYRFSKLDKKQKSSNKLHQ